MKIENRSEGVWSLVAEAAPPSTARKRRGAGDQVVLPAAFLPEGAEVGVVLTATASPAKAARRGATAPIDFSAEVARDEHLVLAARDEGSGALTFHAPVSREPRAGTSDGDGAGVVRFVVHAGEGAGPRRGLFQRVLKLVVVKLKELVIGKLEGAAIALAGRAAEDLWWRKKELREGLFRVVPGSDRLALEPAPPGAFAGGRCLLLIHGTFSNAAAAFGGLVGAAGRFFDAARAVYGDRIFAFDHFTVSRTPEENAEALLAALPEQRTTFDVITHSRGGLVLRCLVEGPGRSSSLATRFALGNAVLVAAPNQGTPLATPRRWDETLGLMANLIELLPSNPWTTGADFVANGLLWLAKHVTGDLPGLASMDGDGETIANLQGAGGPAEGQYWTLGANFHPDARWWQRLVDAGVDRFFDGANDLVVPAEGSWLIDGPGAVVPAHRIACFGAGGNLGNPSVTSVHHVSFFDQAETVAFLLHALGLRPMAVRPLPPSTLLPVRRLLRGTAGATVFLAPSAPREAPHLEAVRGNVLDEQVLRSEPESYASDTLHLLILGGDVSREVGGAAGGERRDPVLLAVYGSARVLEALPVRNGAGNATEAGSRFERIIRRHESIRRCLDGTADAKTQRVPDLPSADELRAFGQDLFESLFVGAARRLYDVARSEQRDRPLNIVLTCTVPWLAAKPWEFAFDPSRRKFLATEEVHFTRNVLTAVPAQRIAPRAAPLRLLLVAAQPKGVAGLALEEEEARMKQSFRALIDAGLVTVDVLMDATPTALHDRIQARDREGARYDIVHFAGHGLFDRDANAGKLLFVGVEGGVQEVDVRTLREILCGRGIHLVFLNACDTARDGEGGDARNRGVAQALVEGGMPGVVANQYKVLDSAAVSFSERFYWSLALGASLGEAAREARIAVNYSVDGEAIDWAVPVLYARDPGVRLCGRLSRATPAPVRPAGRAARGIPTHTALTRSGREAPATGPIRVGVADIARYFPDLSDTLSAINGVQDRIALERAEVVVPLGVWQVHQEGRSRTRYLVADRFAEKLKKRPLALGVDYLVCITDHPMCDEHTLNIYGWWSASADVPILLFSTWALDLDATGTNARRAVANGIVESLAAQLVSAHDGTECMHEVGSKSCPFHYNAERLVDHIAGRLRFESRCRQKLLDHLPEALDPPSLVAAFDAILGAFDPPSEPSPESPPRKPRRRARR
jgi:hypothetical protein